ncbi:DEAD/DEAH box helicase family protein [Nocardia sp. NBC_00508]|uniref:DEAD/DEAH box helicase family protein n=1 Tax=Nocardia sp. NBC_00508 TaxID=2975992 RepID=UPI002E80F4D4|nr:DEAD/DEAH box helicase family protein [Nocardia sp. NBC_00508]WUD68766.1 DEAD/DEAH box helicase family protein [Nocardia sp. NBC_00508]
MSSDVGRVAQYSPNFGFLLPFEPLLVAYGTGAEASVYTDPNATLVKCRQFIEVLVAELVRRAGTKVASDALEVRIRALSDAGVITGAMATALHEVRRRGNNAVHGHLDDRRQALDSVNKCFQLGLVLYRAISNDRKPMAFVPPQPPQRVDFLALQQDLDRYKQELADARLSISGHENLLSAEATARQQVEQELAQRIVDQDALTAQLAAMTAQIADLEAARTTRLEAASKIAPADRYAFIDRARRPEPLNEAQARRVIDRMLVEAGWLVQDMPELAPTTAVGVAVREFPFAGGRSDYALYVQGKLVGIVEAKREGTSLTGVEPQTAGYAHALPKQYSLAAWRRDEPLPFRYESTGVETRFTDQLDPVPRSRRVFSFHRPETVSEWMANADKNSAAPTFRSQVRELPPLIEGGLRPAQIQAINGVESSLAQDRPRTLVQMATGAGKTYTAVTEAYRLLAHTDARRILFLVDRNNLGEQASGEFHNFTTPDDGRKFDELFNVDRLTGDTVLASTNVVIGTIQRLFMALRGERLPNADDSDADDFTPEVPVDVVYSTQVPPETFDLIVVDECHRSIYGQWRAVLEYFDAPIVGLTATPTAQTLGFFDRNLASEYTYEQAVADGVNVEFDVYRIKTKISEQGSTIEALDADGTRVVVPRRDRRTRLQRYEELEEDFSYTGRQIGRSVLAKDQIRLVLETFKNKTLPEAFPDRQTVPKTLFFARSDEHADDIVQAVREIFGKGNDFAVKITYKSRAQGSDPKQLLQLFRTSAEMRIAVTVDMIATGTDVRPLEVVFFMRDVQSAVYFEQMKGRGARTVDDIEFQQVTPDPSATAKTRFLIVDAVGVTDSPLCDAQPLNRERSKSLRELLSRAASLSITENETATLASRLNRLNEQIDDDHRAELTRVGNGTSLRDIVRRLVNAIDTDELIHAEDEGGDEAVQRRLHDAVGPLADNPDLRKRILAIRHEYDTTIDEISQDELLEATGVPRENAARNTVTSFQQFVADNLDQVIVQQLLRGTDKFSYGDLQDLAAQIRRIPQIRSVDTVWEAYADLGQAPYLRKQENDLTNLITLLRYVLGREHDLQPYCELVGMRYERWIEKQRQRKVTFTVDQRWFLDAIVKVVATSARITPDDLQRPPFDQRGGAFGLMDAFGDRADTLIDELNEELTA